MVFVAVLAALLASGPAGALTITGPGTALNAYSFSVDGYEVYLLGVDSVERTQGCEIDRRDWDCGIAAIRHLEEVLYEGPVTCETVFGPDGENRVVAICTLYGDDLGGRLIAEGFAVAMPNETTRYAALETEARAAGVGLWQGRFTPPAIFRSRPMAPQSTRPAFYPPVPID
ncbi:MAG: thermonuclease family protein [Bauldia sp.]